MNEPQGPAPPGTGRVLFASSITHYGGGERWMCDAACGLKAKGHDVHVVSRPGSALAGKLTDMGVENSMIEMRADLDPLAIVRFAQLIRRYEPQVVCVNLDREVRIAAAALSLVNGLSRVNAGSTRLIPRRGSEFPLKDKAHYRFVYQRLVDRVIANSQATKKTMLSRTPWFPQDKAVVIYNGIDPAPYEALAVETDKYRHALRQELNVDTDSPLVTLVGELNERKGHRFVIDAADSILAKVPHAHFVFVGEGDARSSIEAAVDNKAHAGHFHLLGFRGDVPEILTASDVLVLPSRIEGFGYVLVEAMAAGLPVVATEVSSIPEIVVDGTTGFLHSFGDSGAIADRLIQLLGEPDRARKMGRAGKQVVAEKFNIATMIEHLEHLFFETGPFSALPKSL